MSPQLSNRSRAQAPPARKLQVPTEQSYASLDIRDLTRDCESILASSLTFQSSLDSTRSFNDVPPFTPGSSPKAFFLNLHTTPGLSPAGSSVYTSSTAPTTPRLKAMLMEPICVGKWAEDLRPGPLLDHKRWDEKNLEDNEASITLPWIPEGSIFAPEAFQAIFRRRRSTPDSIISDQDDTATSRHLPLPTAGLKKPTNAAVPMHKSSLNTQGPASSPDTHKLGVPTIMVSSSSTSLMSPSPNIVLEAPLALRRGQKMPVPLAIGKTPSKAKDTALYPGIPTPFLGSPSTYSPKFEFSGDPAKFSMGLEAMCAELRSLCPEVRSPTVQDDAKWSCAPVHSLGSSAESDDDDEWAFAKSLLAYDDISDDGSISEAPATPLNAPVVASDAVYDESLSWGNSPTFTNSGATEEQGHVPQTPGSLKLQRRRTVIIETRSSVLRNSQAQSPTSPTVLELSDDFDRSIPLETSVHFAPDLCLQSTPPSRPPSTLKPVRGILKEKKSVRFSALPSTHEHTTQPLQISPRKRAATTPSASLVRHSSPLRQSYTPEMHAASPQPPNNGTSFPRHPALPTTSRGSAPVPILRTPAAAGRVSFRSIQPRQSLPVNVKRISQAPVVAKSGRNSTVVKEDVGKPRRLMKAMSIQPARPRKDENSMRRSVEVKSRVSAPPKSRMPVPFRSILIKFRA